MRLAIGICIVGSSWLAACAGTGEPNEDSTQAETQTTTVTPGTVLRAQRAAEDEPAEECWFGFIGDCDTGGDTGDTTGGTEGGQIGGSPGDGGSPEGGSVGGSPGDGGSWEGGSVGGSPGDGGSWEGGSVGGSDDGTSGDPGGGFIGGLFDDWF